MHFTTSHSLLLAVLASQALAAPAPRAEPVVRDTADGAFNSISTLFLL